MAMHFPLRDGSDSTKEGKILSWMSGIFTLEPSSEKPGAKRVVVMDAFDYDGTNVHNLAAGARCNGCEDHRELWPLLSIGFLMK